MNFKFLLSKEKDVEECDATMLNRYSNAGHIKYGIYSHHPSSYATKHNIRVTKICG
jgi:hypothetical protein